MRHSRAFSRHRSAIIHYREADDQSISATQWLKLPVKIRLSSFAQRAPAAVRASDLLFVPSHYSSSVPAEVQVLAVILSEAKDPEEFDSPLPFEPFRRGIVRSPRSQMVKMLRFFGRHCKTLTLDVNIGGVQTHSLYDWTRSGELIETALARRGNRSRPLDIGGHNRRL